MNYINLLNRFWGKRREYRLTSIEADLYLFLAHRCNKLRWENPFCLPTKDIQEELGLPRQTINNARKRLENVGLITFQQGLTKGKSAKYSLCDCVISDDTMLKECVTSDDTITSDCVISDDTIQEKEKRKEKENIPPTPPIKEKENKKEKELASLDTRDTHTREKVTMKLSEIKLNAIEELRMTFSARMASEQMMKANRIHDRQEYLSICDEILAEWEIARGINFEVNQDVKRHFINLIRIKSEKRKQRGAGAKISRQDKREELMQSALQSVNNAINNNYAINNEQTEITPTF